MGTKTSGESHGQTCLLLEGQCGARLFDLEAQIVFWENHWPSAGKIVQAAHPDGPWNVIGEWGAQPSTVWSRI